MVETEDSSRRQGQASLGATPGVSVGGGSSCSTFYAKGVFPSSRPSAPPIYRTAGGGRRAPEHIQLDIRLRDSQSSRELLGIITESLDAFDIGNVVVAFTVAAKTDEGRDMATLEPAPAWDALRARLTDCAHLLEPRGMSMCAYAAAKLLCGGDELLASLARSGAKRAADFGTTDLAKSCWAFAKLRYLDEVDAAAFWASVAPEAESRCRGARFVDVSMIAWAFAMTGCGTPGIYAQVAACTKAECSELPPRSIAGIAWAVGKGRHQDAQLFRDMSQQAIRTMPEFTAHDAAALCWGYSAAGVRHERLFDALADHLLASKMIARLSLPLAAELAWAYAAAGVRRADLFLELDRLCATGVDKFETEDVAGFLWAFATLGNRNLQSLDAFCEFSRRFEQRFRRSELKVISWALQELGAAQQAEKLQARLHHLESSGAPRRTPSC
eukprot:TRINITY_DN16540_c0_g1_i1.p1 TRINITY_DN16540_c0_g1~~TRINITY_DN16540_c0_g1_i1.p1  ORF type:complete len:442 (-),score=85.36 TRINITY_DN16540_c0_g1_i1:21-1346(-)